MELDRLKILVERYLEAETTLDEERELADIFAAGEDIPEEYEPVRAMFQTFDAIKEQGAPNIEGLWYKAQDAAASALLILSRRSFSLFQSYLITLPTQ